MLASIGFYIIASVFTLTGVEHLRDPSRLIGSLSGHGIFASRWIASIAAAAIAVELSLAATSITLIAAHVDSDSAIRATAGVATCILLVYAFYSWIVLHRNPTAICGCSSVDHPINIWVALRALLLAAFALIPLMWPWLVEKPAALPVFEGIIMLLSTFAWMIIAWHAPAALAVFDGWPGHAPDGSARATAIGPSESR